LPVPLSPVTSTAARDGARVPVGVVTIPSGGSWGADGDIIVGSGYTKCLERISTKGGARTTVLDLEPSELFCASPQILPGGKAVLFVDFRTHDGNAATIDIFSFSDRRRKTVLRGSNSARYLPSGHLVYTNKGTLFAVPFDIDRLETRGPAVAILDDIAYDAQSGIRGDWDFARNGTLVYHGGGSASETRSILQTISLRAIESRAVDEAAEQVCRAIRPPSSRKPMN
jgi:serine/threonine-protein kinase